MPAGDKSRLVFWQNIPSILQAPLLRSLANRWTGEVTVVTERGLPDRRRALGWERPDFRPARLVISPSRNTRAEVLEEAPEASVHIFSGFHAEPNTYATFRAAVRRHLDVGVFAEPARSAGVKGLFRRILYGYHSLRWSRHLKILLATGSLGVDWYRRCGFPEQILHPFAYFVQPLDGSSQEADSRVTGVRFLYVGELTDRKGVDLLLRALGRLVHDEWSLEVIGDGPRSDALRTLTSTLGITDRVRWHGTLPNAVVRSRMEEVDCLVLPSRHDGWGAVVNESLLAGTPVLVSDGAGSSDLIQGDRIGDVFRAGSIEELSGLLRSRVRRGSLTTSQRRAIRGWAETYVSPTAGTQYLLSILRFTFEDGGLSRPTPPWRETGAVELADSSHHSPYQL